MDMNYISVEMVRYAALFIEAIDKAPDEADAALRCNWQRVAGERPCLEPATHFAPDATRVSAGGDIEETPQWFCQEHLELELEKPVREHPVFRRTENPGQ